MPPLHPPGVNPHFLRQSEKRTTRADLFEKSRPGRTSINADEELEADDTRRLDSMVRQSLGNVTFDTPSSKIQKLGVEKSETSMSSGAAHAVFRLVSSTLPPRSISLVPLYFEGVPHQRPIEDTEGEGRLRDERAQQVAVDADYILMQSRLQSGTHQDPSTDFVILNEHYKKSSHLPSLLVTDCDHPRTHSSRAEVTTVKCCPVIPLRQTSPPVVSRKRRSNKAAPRKNHVSPRFFRPLREWGGKSAGYAMGWRNSHPAIRPGSDRYLRDAMRKGVFSRD